MKPPENWRSEQQIRGIQSQVQKSINQSTDGAYAIVDLSTAHAMADICRQARWTEKGPPP